MDRYLTRLQQAIASVTDGINHEQLTRHPEGKWCVGEVLEHLYLTYTGTVRGFQHTLESGKLLERKPTLQERFRTAVVVGAGYFPTGREAPQHTRPRGMPPEKVLAEIGPAIASMDEVLTQCEGRYGPWIRVDHPVLGPLTPRQWRKFHWVHGRHHVKQILRLRQTAGG
jgi:hypothetical protein